MTPPVAYSGSHSTGPSTVTYSSRPPLRGPAPPAIADRPKCAGCGKPRAPDFRTGGDWRDGTAFREWTGRWRGYGHFHSASCAVDYANAIVEARARNVVKLELVKP